MSQSAGGRKGIHEVESDEEREDDEQDPRARDAGSHDSPDKGTTMTPGGAMPAGGAMDHWATAMPNTDATKPETMPKTKTEPLPGETRDSNPA